MLVQPLTAQWQKMDTPFKPANISGIDSNHIWCFTFNTGHITRTNNGGNSWTSYSLPNAEGFLLGSFLTAIDSSKAWASFNHYNSGIRYVYNTQDGGQTWQAAKPIGLTDNQIIRFQHFNNYNNGFIISWDLADFVFIHQTINGGQSWTTKSLPINGSLLGITTFENNHIWFYTGSGELWRSSDGGANWSTIQTPLIATSYGLAMAFTDSLNGLAFKDHYTDQLYRTSDGGTSWLPIQGPTNPASAKIYAWGITAIPGLEDAYIVGHNDGTSLTRDGGDTWYVERNYPDYDFNMPVFKHASLGWASVQNQNSMYRWNDPIETIEAVCLTFNGPVKGKVRRSKCHDLWFEGSVSVDIANDPEIHLNVQLFYPDYAPNSGLKYHIVKNLSTGCPDCSIQFVPDPGQTTIGQLLFDIPLKFAPDTTDNVICTISPTQCRADSLHTFEFKTGYFANWFHEECFQIDSSNCAVELLTNTCGIDTNQYIIYVGVGGNILPGSKYEKNPSFNDPVNFYIYAYGDFTNSTCYEVINTLYNCGTSGTNTFADREKSTLRIWPNPATDDFRLSISPVPDGNLDVRIKNSAGYFVWSESRPHSDEAYLIDPVGLESGFYILEVWAPYGLIGTSKLVILK